MESKEGTIRACPDEQDVVVDLIHLRLDSGEFIEKGGGRGCVFREGHGSLQDL